LVQVKAQAKECEFGELEDSLVEGMIVLSTRSNSDRERLFTETYRDLDLGKAVTFCRSAEQAVAEAVAAMDANRRRFGQGQMDVKGHGMRHDTRRAKNFIVFDVPESMANGRVQHLANNVEDVVRMVISTECVRSAAPKVNNQE
jgi:hypothetical protein